MKAIIEEQLLVCCNLPLPMARAQRVAEGHFFVWTRDDWFRRNPLAGTIRNLAKNSRIEITFVDPFARKGYHSPARNLW